MVRKETLDFIFLELRVPPTKKKEKCTDRAGVKRPRLPSMPVPGFLQDLGWSLLSGLLFPQL